MNWQHRTRANKSRERQKSLKHRLAANRASFDFLQRQLQADIDDDKTETENVQGASGKD